MVTYNVRVYNDMGHLMTDPGPEELSFVIAMFISRKSLQYLRTATDKKGHGCRFYVLRDGFQRFWTYTYKNTTLNIEWPTDVFNLNTMTWL